MAVIFCVVEYVCLGNRILQDSHRRIKDQKRRLRDRNKRAV